MLLLHKNAIGSTKRVDSIGSALILNSGTKCCLRAFFVTDKETQGCTFRRGAPLPERVPHRGRLPGGRGERSLAAAGKSSSSNKAALRRRTPNKEKTVSFRGRQMRFVEKTIARERL